MGYNQRHGGIIWTNHALSRLRERKLPQHIAFSAFQNPDQRRNGRKNGTHEFIKQHGKHTITLIASRNERKEWVVLSCWIDPPFPGTSDHRKREAWRKYKKSGFWGKLWYVIKRQLGIVS